MKAITLIEFISAAADTRYVIGPFSEPGGIMINGGPGSMKTTVLNSALNGRSDTVITGDMNVQQWIKLKDDFVSKRFRILCFPELQKIYQRHPSTASNLQGIIQQLVSDGYTNPPNGDIRASCIPAYAIVMAAITSSFYEQHYDEWRKDGFLRRFLWLTIGVQNPDLIMEAIRNWEKIDLGRLHEKPAIGQIEVKVSKERSMMIERIMRDQPGLHGNGYILMKKIVAVLEWKYGSKSKKIDEMLEELTPAFLKTGGEIEL